MVKIYLTRRIKTEHAMYSRVFAIGIKNKSELLIILSEGLNSYNNIHSEKS